MATKAPRDMEAQMMHGCAWFLVAAFGGFALAVWPFLAYAPGFELAPLLRNAAIAFLPSLVFGALVSRRGMAGGLGFVASALAVAVFLYLRLEAAELLAQTYEKVPEWPPLLKFLAPLAWVLTTAFVAVLFGRE